MPPNERIEFYDHGRAVTRTNHFNCRTEKNYVGWLYRFIIFHNQRHPKDIDFELDEIIIRDGTFEKVARFERAQVLFEEGKPIMLYCASTKGGLPPFLS